MQVLYSWESSLDEVVERKLKVVIRPVGVVKYCKHPFGGLEGLLQEI